MRSPCMTSRRRFQKQLCVCSTLVLFATIGSFANFCRFHRSYATPLETRSKTRWLSVKDWMRDEYNFTADDALLSRLSEPSAAIPRIIHQSWRSKSLEHFQQEWQKTWLENNPGWTYMFWTDKDNRRLVAEHFPWFLDVYDSFPRNIQRADCARYFYMLHFGGCYFDLDFESMKGLDPLLQNVNVALAYMTTDISSEISIPNAFLASAQGHQFWLYVIKHVLTAFASVEIDKGDAHRNTGPIMLKNAVAQYQLTSPTKDLTIFPQEKVYAVDFNWRDDPKMRNIFATCHAASTTFNATQCKTFFPESFAITYWSGDLTWMAK